VTDRGLWKWSVSLCGSSVREPGGTAPLLGIPKDMSNKVLELGVCFHGGPILGNMGGTLISKGLQEKGEISFYQENSYEELERRVKEISVNGQLSP